ncbi:Indigoidine synthase A like protein-domain-containing protein [Xylariaceae sp. FL0662B]|nr:Indigoidine synthase A like protein-domain-containing protein [Xylariaceae sp. FL0662B]
MNALRCRSRPKTSRASALGNLGGLKDILRVSEEVADALATNKPVVALESTIYTHGALGNDLDLEGVVRRHGGVPAVVGILGGVPTVGLSPEEVTRMVEGSPKKASRRDIAYLVGMGTMGHKIHGGTTIAGTMILARLAGIRVFGTGGLGGVHRGGHESLDISADLTELGRTRMAVISSGCKGFLDIPRTLEYLETQGVLVSTFAEGRTGNIDFPAFWARDSGVKSPSVVNSEEQAAAMILAQENLDIESGLLFANPIPEEFSISRTEMDAIIEQAVRESTEQGALGSENTPFILNRIKELTNGRSVPANKALVRANVKRATEIAVAVSRLVSGDLITSQADILVAGSVAVDLSCDYSGEDSLQNPSPHLHTSNPARIGQSIGGVGYNVALAAHKVAQDSKVRLCSMIGDDIAGSTILSSLRSCGMDTSCVRQLSREHHPSGRTAQYVAVNDANKNLVLGMADMGIFIAYSFPAYWRSAVKASQPKWLVVDGNWADRDIRAWLQAGKENYAQVAFEPVSREKSGRLFCVEKDLDGLGVFPRASVDLATPNQYELAAMHSAAGNNEYFDDGGWWPVIDAFGMRGARDRFVKLTSASMTDAGIPQQAIQLLPYIPTIVTKIGQHGALLAMILRRDDPRLRDPASEKFILSRTLNDHPDVGGVYMRLFPSVEEVKDMVSVNGVGDTFLGILVAGLARGAKVEDLINIAQKGAVLTLGSSQSVSEDLGMLESELIATTKYVRGYDKDRKPYLSRVFLAMPPTRPIKPVDGDGEDDEVMSSSGQEESVYASDEDAVAQTRQEQTIDKDSDEEELEQLVLGGTANFRANLFKDDSRNDGTGLGHPGDGDENGQETGLEDMDDAQLFAFDVRGTRSDDTQLAAAPIPQAPHASDKDAPAWEDSDDERLTISLATATQLRKLRISEAEDVVNGVEYTRRLRQQYLRLNPLPDWAKESNERPAKRRRRSSAASDNSDVSNGATSSEDEDAEASALPLDKFLRDASALRGEKAQRTKRLRPEVIDIQRSRDIPDVHKEAVTSLAFHPEYPVLLSSSTSSMLYLHHIAPTAHPTPNPLLTSAQVKQVPVRRAEFLYPIGDKIFFAGRRRYIHSWDMASGTIQKTNKIQGHRLEQKTWERFRLSPCGQYMGLIATTRKGGGIINVLNVNTMQWIAAARLDSRGGIADFSWWSNGHGLTILGKAGQVGEWSMASRRFLGVWNDEGSNGGTVIALGGRNGPVLLGGDRWVAIGSNSGVVNVYDRQSLILPSADDEPELQERPEPKRSFMQLTTPITVLTFSPDGQLLAFGSKHKTDAFRLAHMPSCTVYRNWPTQQTPLGRISDVAFGRKSDLLAVGNDAGKIRLWEIRS